MFKSLVILGLVGCALAATTTPAAPGKTTAAPAPGTPAPGPAAAAGSCKKTCAAGCMLIRNYCTEIPGVVDCSMLGQGCDAFCTGTCSCADQCPTKCKVVDDKCLKPNGCGLQKRLCVAFCNINCPIATVGKYVASQIQVALKQIAGIVANIASALTAAIATPLVV